MTADEFARHLAAAAPSADSLAKVGMTGIAMAHFRQSFLSQQRVELANTEIEDAAITLVDRWDARNVEIGMVRFLNGTSLLSNGTQIGIVEADPLVVLPQSGELAVVDADLPNQILWYVAEDGRHLLDALLLAARFFVRRVIGEIDLEDMQSARAQSHLCSTAAGGDKYHPFYSMLLGAEP